jgi:cell division protein FtsI/penicillin-binding protein 2
VRYIHIVLPAACKSRTLAILLISCFFLPAFAQNVTSASLHRALAGTQARAVLIDMGTGHVEAAFPSIQAVQSTYDSPGSTLKPFVLLAALQQYIVQPQTTVECTGQLTVGTHRLACTHPRELHLFTAEQALAYSCNSYFASVATHMPAQTLLQSLTTYGLRPTATGTDTNSRILLALGLENLRISPLQLASAYRQLAPRLDTDPTAPPVRDGLFGSVRYGMAHNAFTEGILLAGKTGTAAGPGMPSHGWFAGIVYTAPGQPRSVLVVYLPNANGGDAALLAHRILAGDTHP